MNYNLAVAYRPRRFDQVAGQAHAKAVLKAVSTAATPVHQILLSGTSGCGKTTLARLLASAIFCNYKTGDGEPCGNCESCALVAGGSHPDVIEMDAASFGGVDQIREMATTATHAPMLADYRIFIIDEAHGLTHTGAQAFLKLLEEPPAHTIFVRATTDPGKLPLAVRGRCLQIEILDPTTTQLQENLTRICSLRGWPLDDDTATAIIAATDPQLGVRGTVMTLSKLAPILDSGSTPTGQQLKNLLACAPTSQIRDIVTSACTNRTENTLTLLTQGLEDASAMVVRGQLLFECFNRIKNTEDAHLVTLVRLLERITSCQPTPIALTVAVAGTVLPPTAVAEPETSTPKPDVVEEPAKPPVQTPQEQAKPLIEEAERQEMLKPVVPTPAVEDPEVEENPLQLLNALAAVSAKAALAARSASLSYSDGTWTLKTSGRLSAEQAALLNEAVMKLDKNWDVIVA